MIYLHHKVNTNVITRNMATASDTERFQRPCHHRHRRLSALLWVILLVIIGSLQVIGTASHHHSTDEHMQQRMQEWRRHQQRQSLALEDHRKPQLTDRNANNNKSSQLWLMNSQPNHNPRTNDWAFQGWHRHLITSAAITTTTSTTSTTTPRPTPAAKTPFPSLWNYASKKGAAASNQHTNRTISRELNPKHGRHVCVESRTAATTTVLQPVRMGNPATSAAAAPCTSSSNQICGEDQRRRRKPNGSNIVYKCCPGWAQMYKHSRGCNKPICDRGCRNGGKCIRPNTCTCPSGWTGDQCQDDIDECSIKVCDQLCTNTPGSFRCSCRERFQLQEDRTSCKSTDSNHVALEASEMNGEDIDLDEVDHRLKKLERSLGQDVDRQSTFKQHLDKLMNRMTQLEQYQYDNEVRLKAVEDHAKKTENMVHHLFKCQQYPEMC